MGVTQADSGPVTDNAGRSSKGIDDAISAALDASDTRSLSDALKSKEAEEPAEVSDPVLDEAGDGTTTEDANDAEESHAKDVGEDDGFNKPLKAPKHWPEADKQAFGKLTREGQEIALKLAKNLEGGFTRRSQELSDKVKFADGIRGLFDDTSRAQLQQAGLDEAGYIQYLHRLQTFASREPVAYVKWAMQNLGITPEQLGISQAKDQGQAQAAAEKDPLAELLADPKVSEMEAKLKALEDRIVREDAERQRAQYAQRANSLNQIQTHIRAFREMLDEGGQLKNPHFDTVKAHMGALMDSDPDLSRMEDGPEKLQTAYEMAVWSRPDLRQSLIEAEAQKKIHEAQKKRDAERAKRATSVKPSAGVVSTRPKSNSLDDAISQAASKHGF